MKKIYLFIALFACALCSCGSDEDGMTYAQPVEIGETTDMKTAKGFVFMGKLFYG